MTYSLTKGTDKKKNRKIYQRVSAPQRKRFEWNEQEIETMRCWKGEL